MTSLFRLIVCNCYLSQLAFFCPSFTPTGNFDCLHPEYQLPKSHYEPGLSVLLVSSFLFWVSGVSVDDPHSLNGLCRCHEGVTHSVGELVEEFMAAVVKPRKNVLKDVVSSCNAELSIIQYYVTGRNPG